MPGFSSSRWNPLERSFTVVRSDKDDYELKVFFTDQWERLLDWHWKGERWSFEPKWGFCLNNLLIVGILQVVFIIAGKNVEDPHPGRRCGLENVAPRQIVPRVDHILPWVYAFIVKEWNSQSQGVMPWTKVNETYMGLCLHCIGMILSVSGVYALIQSKWYSHGFMSSLNRMDEWYS